MISGYLLFMFFIIFPYLIPNYHKSVAVIFSVIGLLLASLIFFQSSESMLAYLSISIAMIHIFDFPL